MAIFEITSDDESLKPYRYEGNLAADIAEVITRHLNSKDRSISVALNEVQEAAQDEAAAQATTEKAKTVYTFTMPDGDVTISVTKAAKTYEVKVADANKDTLKITSPEADLDKVYEDVIKTLESEINSELSRKEDF